MRWGFFGGVVVLLVGGHVPGGLGVVKVKMLPFDNKSEFMVQLDLPAGRRGRTPWPWARTWPAGCCRNRWCGTCRSTAGEAAPFTFVGMVRHSFLRQEDRMVDIQVNLVAKGERKEQSHAIAVRLRPGAAQAGHARRHPDEAGRDPARPAGHGHPGGRGLRAHRGRAACASPGRSEQAFRSVDGVVDVDSTLNPTSPKLSLVLDREKAALHGVAPAQVIQTLYMAGQGHTAGQLPRATGAPPRCRWCSSWPAPSASGWTRSSS